MLYHHGLFSMSKTKIARYEKLILNKPGLRFQTEAILDQKYLMKPEYRLGNMHRQSMNIFVRCSQQFDADILFGWLD